MKLCKGCTSPAKCTAAGKCLKTASKAYGGMATKKKPAVKKAYGGLTTKAKKSSTAKKKK